IAQSFADMIQQLEDEPLYAPAEAELTTAALTTKLTDMQNANDAVVTSFVPVSNNRITRDKVLYDDDDGIFMRSGLVKKYVKSVFGADSPEFAQVSGLQFTEPR